MSRRKTIVIAVILVVCIVIAGTTIYRNQMSSRKKLFSLEDDFWKVYINLSETKFDAEGRAFDGLQENGEDYINYFIKASEAVELIYKANKYGDKGKIAEAQSILECLMTTYNKYGKFPRPAYQELEEGWVSSMDAPVVALASELMYEYTGEKKYREYALELLPYTTKKLSGGGYNIELDGGLVWPLEYGDNEATPDTAKFVLNGSLVGYISMKALSDIIKDDELEEYLLTVEKTYAEMFPRFRKGETWTYYMLHPLTVIPVHYMIFEEKLLQAAWNLSGQTAFQQEYEYRRNCLKGVLGIDFVEENGIYSYYMLRACSPNYYQIDTYATQIEFCDEKGEVISTRSITGSGSMNGKNRQFINSLAATGTLINLPYSYNVYSGERDDLYLLFSDKVRLSDGEDQEKDYSFTGVARDANVSEQNQIKLISIDKDQDPKAEGDIVYKLDEPLSLNMGIFLIEINNLSDQDVPIGLLLYDSEGNGCNRYYMPLLPGANAVVFDERGFVGAEDLKDISSVWLRIYDENIDISNVLLYPGNLKVFEDHKNYIRYIDRTGYTINPQ